MNKEEKWEFMYSLARDYYKTYCNLNINVRYVITIDGVSYNLGRWIYYQRKQKRRGLLPKDKEEKLNLIKMLWRKNSGMFPYDWQFYFDLVKEYYKENPDKEMPEDYEVWVNQEIIPLGKWLKNEKARSYARQLSKYQLKEFNKIGLFTKTKTIRNWDYYYDLCVWYYKKNNNLLIPYTYTITIVNKDNKEEAVHLGSWLATQRRLKKEGKLTEKQIELLDGLYIVWSFRKTSAKRDWDFYYELLKNYYDKEHNINMSRDFKVIYKDEVINLGEWLYRNKYEYYQNKLSAIHKEKLEKLGIAKMPRRNSVKIFYPLAKAYYQKHGHLNISENEYVLNERQEKVYLYYWLAELRKKYHQQVLSQKQIDALNAIGMIWSVIEYKWTKMYNYAVAFYKEHGHLNIPFNYEFIDNNETIKLGVWINYQRKSKKKNTLSASKIALLEKLNIVWEFTKDWDFYYNLLKENFYQYHNHIEVPKNYSVLVDGEMINLSNWLATQKHKYMTDKLDEDKIAKLNALNIIWIKDTAFMDKQITTKEDLLKLRKRLTTILNQALKIKVLEVQEVEQAFQRQLSKY